MMRPCAAIALIFSSKNLTSNLDFDPTNPYHHHMNFTDALALLRDANFESDSIACDDRPPTPDMRTAIRIIMNRDFDDFSDSDFDALDHILYPPD